MGADYRSVLVQRRYNDCQRVLAGRRPAG